MMPFDELTPEKKLQVNIVRIDIIVERIWHLLRIAIPILIIIMVFVFLLARWRRRR